jgi:hypothetical protein
MADNPLLNDGGDPFDFSEFSPNELQELKRRVQKFILELNEELFSLTRLNPYLSGDAATDYIERLIQENHEDGGFAHSGLEHIEKLLRNQ